MGSALSVKNYESPADRRLAGGFLADTSYWRIILDRMSAGPKYCNLGTDVIICSLRCLHFTASMSSEFSLRREGSTTDRQRCATNSVAGTEEPLRSQRLASLALSCDVISVLTRRPPQSPRQRGCPTRRRRASEGWRTITVPTAPGHSSLTEVKCHIELLGLSNPSISTICKSELV